MNEVQWGLTVHDHTYPNYGYAQESPLAEPWLWCCAFMESSELWQQLCAVSSEATDQLECGPDTILTALAGKLPPDLSVHLKLWITQGSSSVRRHQRVPATKVQIWFLFSHLWAFHPLNQLMSSAGNLQRAKGERGPFFLVSSKRLKSFCVWKQRL